METKENSSTAEEAPTKHRGWKAMPYIIGNEAFEKLGSIGTGSNLLVYLTSVFHMQSVSATTLINFFHGTSNFAPVFGAFLSDTYFGRYVTLGFASISSLVGMFILTLTAAVPSLHPPQCGEGQACVAHTRWQLAVLLTSFAFQIIGAGGIRPCNLAFGADQFDPRTESGKKGIASFFNWYYFTLAFAILVSSTAIIYIQSDVSWAWGLAIPTMLMLLSCVFFFAGTRIYVVVKPEGSPFTSIAQVLVAAFRKRRLRLPDDPKQTLFDPPHSGVLNCRLGYTDQFRFLDKASIVTPRDNIKPNGAAETPWRLCTLQQVEQLKCLLRIIPVWSANIIFNVAHAQMGSYMVLQALQSDRRLGKSHFEIPAASFTIFSMLSISLWVPLYDRVLVPWLRRCTGREGGITLLQRMGTGLVLSIVGMVMFGLVEEERRRIALRRPTIGTANGGGAVSAMSGLWLIPPQVVLGVAEAFNAIGQVEFYYKQFPENMRSLAGALFFCNMAVSSYVSGFMVTIVHRTTGGKGRESWLAEDLNKGKLDYFYFLIAAMGVVNLAYFLACASWYRYKALDTDTDTDHEVELEAIVTKFPA
ncbi:putative protein NRT1/ PTR FAMILY 2.11 [Iris pallida]|uniref:Uncharacterized protein n=1 Tax=Iris pallida TaxID=29817 RepID=A0AAX6FXF5_IRIPA|nr:putative protein NRT1/ PTR FAMILY 2.11 [Iris pallida]KAJ6820718.1 putative protein NRT1/ PTR FAMILY 2.11 [Iris pallida]